MSRSAIREQAFKLIYSLEIQRENLKEQTEIYIENAEITDNDTKLYINDIVEGIDKNTVILSNHSIRPVTTIKTLKTNNSAINIIKNDIN